MSPPSRVKSVAVVVTVVAAAWADVGTVIMMDAAALATKGTAMRLRICFLE
jgi:hypothetical protein